MTTTRGLLIVISAIAIFAIGAVFGFKLRDISSEPRVVYRFVSLTGKYRRLSGKRLEWKNEIKLERIDSLQLMMVGQEEELRRYLRRQ
jgi:hypothetical protein